MLIIIYSETNQSNILENLGKPEYSYYFVLKEFRPVLERLGRVVEVTRPDDEVDQLYADCLGRGEDCVFLSFSPHRTAAHYACPTIAVFAWEFSTIPTESWQGEPRHDWRVVLGAIGMAITHSSFTVKTVREVMGRIFPSPLLRRRCGTALPHAARCWPSGRRWITCACNCVAC